MNIESFAAKHYGAVEIFTRENIPFYVPIYQRTYNWTYNKEIKILLQDLKDFNDLNYKLKKASYYLGNIVLKASKDKVTDAIEKYSLIDGQQRLTTLIILFNVLKLKLNNLKDFSKEDIENYQRKIDKIIFTNQEKRILKISNNINDGLLRNLFSLKEFFTNDKTLRESIYYKNFIGMAEEIKIQSIEDWEKWFNIIKSIKLVQITLGDNDNPISIFESINSRGLHLNVLDLVKNYFFLVSENLSLKEDIKKRIDELFTQKILKLFIERNGEVNEKLINRFFAAFITLETQEDPKKEWKNIYDCFKSKHMNDYYSSEKKFINLIEKIERSFNVYSDLQDKRKKFKREEMPNNEIEIAFIADTKFELYLPLIFSIYETQHKGIIDDSEVTEIFKILEFHNIVLSFGSGNKDNKFIIKYLIDKKCNIRKNELMEFLVEKGKSGNKSGLPSYGIFVNNFIKKDIYTFDKKIARYVLYRIEKYLRKETNEDFIFNKWTLEHIFPQNIERWEDKFEDEGLKEEYINTIGNLLLATSKTNSSMQNKSYREKEKFFNDSTLKLAKELLKNWEEWEIKESNNSVKDRSHYLLNLFSQIWDIEILKEVVSEEDNNIYASIVNRLLLKKNKLSIKDALSIIMFKSNNKLLSLHELEKEIKEVHNSSDEDNFSFSYNKISRGGWMTERMHSNSSKASEAKFEELMFVNENQKWSLEKNYYKKMKKKLEN